ncbi:hypothetical protein ACIBUR_02950 [Streptomyces anulatus]
MSKAKCSGTVHRVVFDRGSITYPDHPPNNLQDAACYRSPHLRAVDEARRAAGPLPYFPLGHFAQPVRVVAAGSSRMALAPGKRPARPGHDGLVRAEVASAGPSGAEWTIHSDLDRTVLHA